MLRLSFVACVVLGLFLQLEAQMSKEEEQEMLHLHNQARKDIMDCNIPGQPAAQKLPAMVWDDELAKNAQVWASACIPGHDKKDARKTKKFPQVGQNWAGARTLNVVFRGWFTEYEYYNYDKLSCSKKCGHYTQIIDARSTHLGCAKSKCPQGWHSAWVCNYGPAGNMRFMDSTGKISVLPPYKKDNKCGE